MRDARMHHPEERWRGVGVSEGAAVGHVLRIHNRWRRIYRLKLDDEEVKGEVERFRLALGVARRQLMDIKARAEEELGAEHSYIFDAHSLMLNDRKLLDEIENLIREENANAEWAVKIAAERLLAIYSQIKDDYLRQRGSDIEDVTQRILLALTGERADSKALAPDAVVVAEDLLPSAVAEMDLGGARAIATDAGGWTSHTAILARGLGIPAVVGLRDLHRRARTGDEIVVDAFNGEVVLHPSKATVIRYSFSSHKELPDVPVPTPDEESTALITLDAVEIFLRANVEVPAEFERVRAFGAHGIGLYRSEFLLARSDGIPSEDEQYEAYKLVGGFGGEDGATIRLFDLAGDKVDRYTEEIERNPALGLRAIRYGLRNEEVLRRQIRAILRAAATRRLSIVLPMITDVMDVRRTRLVIENERANLLKEGKECGAIKVGAMIEVPSAVFTANQIALEVDFFSLGTNDLVQYLLAVDRGNDEVADWFRSLHPAVLHSIRLAVAASASASIPLVVCGEMAGSPVYAVLMAGLGITEFSMNPSAIPRVRRCIAGIKLEDARQIALECLNCSTAQEVERFVRKKFLLNWPHIFSSKMLPAA